MQERTGFESEGTRKDFFVAVRKASLVKSWRELMYLIALPRTSFQNYQYGTHLIPGRVFDKMLSFLSLEKQEFFRAYSFTKPLNWGAVKGGKNCFDKHRNSRLKILEKARAKRKCHLKHVDLSLPLSTDLCEFIGAIIGDGSIDGHLDNGRSHYNVGIYGDSRLDKHYLMEKIGPLIFKLFNVKIKSYFRKDCNGMVVRFYSKRIFKLLTERFGFNAGNKTYTVKIPDEILQADGEFMFATIRGIFDTDGNVFIDRREIYNKPYGRISLKIASQPIHNQLKEFLQKHFSLYVAIKKKNHLNYAQIYEITIYGNKQIEKWMKLIGFSNERHLCKIREIIGSPEWDSNPRPAAYKAAALKPD